MKKYKTGHFETSKQGFVSPMFPQGKQGGETLANEQPTLDEIWEWFENPDEY